MRSYKPKAYRPKTHIKLGANSSLNLGKRSSSITTKLGSGMKLTTGTKGSTFTNTTKLGKGLSITTQNRNGKVSTRLNWFRWKWW